jgi:surface antigen
MLLEQQLASKYSEVLKIANEINKNQNNKKLVKEKEDMLRKMISTMVLIAFIFTTGCAALDTKATKGAGLGAMAGGLAGALIGGNKYKGAAIGAGAGLLLGYIVGNEMDKYDQRKMQGCFESGRSYQTQSWRNDNTGRQYSVTPYPSYNQGGRVYRDVDVVCIVDGQQQTAKASAYRDEYGQWRLVQGGNTQQSSSYNNSYNRTYDRSDYGNNSWEDNQRNGNGGYGYTDNSRYAEREETHITLYYRGRDGKFYPADYEMRSRSNVPLFYKGRDGRFYPYESNDNSSSRTYNNNNYYVGRR